MKKIILLLIFLFFVAGCESKSVTFSKICTEKIDSQSITDVTKTKVIYNNKDEVIKTVITKTYKAKDADGNIVIEGIKKTMENYNNNLAKTNFIKIRNVKNEDDIYKVKYYLDVRKMKRDELEKFGMQKNSIKYFNNLKKRNIKCK